MCPDPLPLKDLFFWYFLLAKRHVQQQTLLYKILICDVNILLAKRHVQQQTLLYKILICDVNILVAKRHVQQQTLLHKILICDVNIQLLYIIGYAENSILRKR